MADPFGRALCDFHEGEQTGPLWQVDGDEELQHPIEDFYFEGRDPEEEATRWLEEHIEGPLVDLGAGAGRDALYFQDRHETVTVEVSELLVELLRDRGVANALLADMFALRGTFDRDQFRSALAIGTQVGLAASAGALRQFLADLAHVTTPDATAVIDGYDPTVDPADEMLGYRGLPESGLAFRVFHFEYGGERGDTLLFRLCSSGRLRESCVGTPWRVRAVRYSGDYYYRAALAKD